MGTKPVNQIPSDGELIRAIQNGDDKEAKAELCLRHDPLIFVLVIAYLLAHGCKEPRDHAGEVTNDVWVNILRSLRTLKDEDKFNAWRDRIARNEARNHLRTCIRGQNSLVDLDAHPELPEGQIFGGARVIEAAKLADEVLGMAERISPKLAEIMQLLHEEGFTWDEIASKLGEKKETLRTFYNRGLIKLKRKMKSRGG
jgi:RNA polymerase sigma factor (sigma-70 family)